MLVDPTHEEFSARLGDALVALGTRVPLAPHEPDVDEMSFAQMREARASDPFPPMPLIVISHGRSADPAERPPGWPIVEEERIWRELHAELARMVPDGRHVIAETSRHDIPQEQPELVVSAIQAVVTAVRDPSDWATPQRSSAVSQSSPATRSVGARRARACDRPQSWRWRSHARCGLHLGPEDVLSGQLEYWAKPPVCRRLGSRLPVSACRVRPHVMPAAVDQRAGQLRHRR